MRFLAEQITNDKQHVVSEFTEYALRGFFEVHEMKADLEICANNFQHSSELLLTSSLMVSVPSSDYRELLHELSVFSSSSSVSVVSFSSSKFGVVSAREIHPTGRRDPHR